MKANHLITATIKKALPTLVGLAFFSYAVVSCTTNALLHSEQENHRVAKEAKTQIHQIPQTQTQTKE